MLAPMNGDTMKKQANSRMSKCDNIITTSLLKLHIHQLSQFLVDHD